jgi:hypothetical protein
MNNAQNFHKELLELLNTDEPDKDSKCLISNLNLDINPVKLSCGHKFNYFPIYNEIIYQKTLTHNLETQKLSKSEIKCPYCRTVQNGLLPSREHFNNIHGVNWPKKYQYKGFFCVYTFKSGKKKGHKCGRKCIEKYCDGHDKIIKTRQAKKSVIKNSGNYCHYVFKRGKNKGKPHGQCKSNNNFCSKHYKLINKPINKPIDKPINLSTFQHKPTNVII